MSIRINNSSFMVNNFGPGRRESVISNHSYDLGFVALLSILTVMVINIPLIILFEFIEVKHTIIFIQLTYYIT